jgi:hypothetical protein
MKSEDCRILIACSIPDVVKAMSVWAKHLPLKPGISLQKKQNLFHNK